MTTKKTLITKLSMDLADASEAQIEAMKMFMRVSFAPAGFKDISFEVVEETEQSLADQVERLLQSVRNEFKENDAPSIRIESQGEILQFPVKNDVPGEGSDGKPRD